VDTDYSNRFELCIEVYTLPTSPVPTITLGPPLNQGVPDHPYSKVIRVTTLHHTHFEKHFLLKTHTFSQIICNKYVKY
jgi:hypothetical protein